MWQTLFYRLLTGMLTLFVVMTLTFCLLRVLPGGPFDLERALPDAIRQNIQAQYHLDRPIIEQYGYYLQNLVHGDLGPSYKFQSRRVSEIVAGAFAVSAALGSVALMVGVFLGGLLGTLSATTRFRSLDDFLTLIGVSSLSIPSFVFGGLLSWLFALQLQWLPVATLQTPLHAILPIAALALSPFAFSFLLVRTSVAETVRQPYVRMKQSTGLDTGYITRVHVLRNSLVPLVSMLGPLAAGVLTGSFAVEYLFAIPGLGKYFVTAVTNRDYTLVMGVTVVYGVLLIALNLLSDMAMVFLDPRLKNSAADT